MTDPNHETATDSREGVQANTCEHFYGYMSPAGSSHSARICMLCHAPDPEWLNEVYAPVSAPEPEASGLREADIELLAEFISAEVFQYRDGPYMNHRAMAAITAREVARLLVASEADRATAPLTPATPPADNASEVLTEDECAVLAEALGKFVRPNGYLAVAVERIVAARETKARAEGAAVALREAADDSVWDYAAHPITRAGVRQWLKDQAVARIARSQS